MRIYVSIEKDYRFKLVAYCNLRLWLIFFNFLITPSTGGMVLKIELDIRKTAKVSLVYLDQFLTDIIWRLNYVRNNGCDIRITSHKNDFLNIFPRKYFTLKYGLEEEILCFNTVILLVIFLYISIIKVCSGTLCATMPVTLIVHLLH